MTSFESLLGVLLVAVVLAAVARRVGAPYPAFLALGGAVLAFVPGAPKFSIDPSVALALFVAPMLLGVLIGSVAAGVVLAWIVRWLTSGVRDAPTAIILQFISTFGVWIIADRLGLSSVLTMFCFAVTVARQAPQRTPARLRVPSYAVWDTAVFLLNVLAFVFIGLQVRPILAGLDPDMRTLYLRVAGLVLLTVIVARIVWV